MVYDLEIPVRRSFDIMNKVLLYEHHMFLIWDKFAKGGNLTYWNAEQN